jgi:two-component system CheB/CheR fusion protein
MDTAHAEFQRQLRSTFAMLRAIVRRTTEGRGDIEDYAAQLEARIGALARINEILMRSPELGVDLQDMICGELLAHAIPAAQYSVAGPDIRVMNHAATPVALTLHELTMNALLHGAFGAPGGQVRVSWECVEQNGTPWLVLKWLERGLTLEPGQLAHKGFGLEIIERTLPYELGARTAFAVTAQGVEAELLIPAESAVPVWRLG